MSATIRLTMAQALVRYLCNQFTMVEGERLPLFPGVFAIFGHGNVRVLPRHLRLSRMCADLAGAKRAIDGAGGHRICQGQAPPADHGCVELDRPGRPQLVTAAGVAHSNRLPVLLLSGDTFVNRRPDPVMQQVEHFGDPSLNVNDAFKAVTRYWDRIVHPEQIISSLPQAVATMLDPAECGPAFIALPQDVQEMASIIPRPSSPRRFTRSHAPARIVRLAQAVQILKRQAAADHFRRRRAAIRARRARSPPSPKSMVSH